MDLKWLPKQLDLLPSRDSSRLLIAAGIVVTGTAFTVVFASLWWIVGLVGGLLAGFTLTLYVLDCADDTAVKSLRDQEEAWGARLASLGLERDEALAAQKAEAEMRVRAAQHEREEAIRRADRAQRQEERMTRTVRDERDEALRERDAGVGEARAAEERARQVQRHAELLEETAREIARQAGRSLLTPPPPPPPPSSER